MNSDRLLLIDEFNFEYHGYSENLKLETWFYDNGDGPETGVYATQKLTLYGPTNSVGIELSNELFNPTSLRKLADQLEESGSNARKKCV